MLRGIYTAAAGMLATQMATDTLANNLANVNTTGFKGSSINFQSFPEMVIQRMSGQGQETVGSLNTGSKVYGTANNFATGAMHETGNTFDMALEGDGFFTVKTAAGQTYYTRAGNFSINDEGYLTTSNGDYVQGELGNIQFKLDQGPFNINTAGEVSAKNHSVIDRLKITRFADNKTLEKVSDTYYQPSPITQILPDAPSGGTAGYQVHQGELEMSNVNPISELVNNIQGMRLYEALQKHIHISNETLEKAVNDVGRVK